MGPETLFIHSEYQDLDTSMFRILKNTEQIAHLSEGFGAPQG